MTDEQAKSGQHMPWQDGLPTAPDVAVLQQHFNDLKAGDRIAYEDVETLLKLTRGSARWKSVTDAWRRREEEAGRVIKCEAGAAFYVATGEQISSSSYGALEHIGRTARKQRRHLATIRTEDEGMRATQQHQSMLMLALERESKKARMNILPSVAPATTAPSIAPPKQAAQ